MARRYEIYKDKEGKYSVYQATYDRLKQASQILNPGKIPSVDNFVCLDRQGLRALLLQWKGRSEDGEFFYAEGNEYHWSYLKTAQERIKSINTEFKNLKQLTINEGKHPPKEMPAEMKERMLKAEAALDICLEEIECLEKKLATFTDSDQKESNSEVLKRGPDGAGRLRDGILILLDGQTVKPDAKNVLRICDTRSPYDGMQTVDYFEYIVPAWHKARSQYEKEQRRQMLLAKEAQRTCSDPGNFPPNPRPQFPAWPATVPKPAQEKENIAPKRTKK